MDRSAQRSYNDAREVARIVRNQYVEAIACLVVGFIWGLGVILIILLMPDAREVIHTPLGALAFLLLFLSAVTAITLGARKLHMLNNRQ